MSLQMKMIRLKFSLTSRERASAIIRAEMRYTIVALTRLDLTAAAQNCQVPPMLGVDRDMRHWSLMQILEHNTIVNRQMYKVVSALGQNRIFESDFNAKTDTIPSDLPGEDTPRAFIASVTDYLKMVAELPDLRQTKCYQHPVFGLLTAHGWHCIFGLHLSVHRKQAQKVAAILSSSAPTVH